MHASPMEPTMSADEITFVPKYKLGYRITLFASPVVVPLAVWGAIVGGRKDPWLYFFLLFAVAMPVIWSKTYRRIRFGQSISFERYVLSPRVVEYSSITDVGRGILKTRQGTFALIDQNCLNVDDFDRAVEESRNRGYWSTTQIDGKLVLQQAASGKAGLIALPLSIAAAILATYLQPGGLHLRFIFWFLIFYLPLAFGSYYFFKRRMAGSA